MKLSLAPATLGDANSFVSCHHRHHKPVPGHKFSLAAVDPAGTFHAVAIVGRPVSRVLDNGWTLEINRLATDGTPNAASMLYRAAWRATIALGFKRLITYTLPKEGGASLRAANFRLVGQVNGGSWNTPSRPRFDSHPTEPKLRWELSLEPPAAPKNF